MCGTSERAGHGMSERHQSPLHALVPTSSWPTRYNSARIVAVHTPLPMEPREAAPAADAAAADPQACPLYDELVIAHLTPAISISRYRDETQLPAIMAIMAKDLSEPYSIFTYRFFLSGWPELCFLVGGAGAVPSVPPLPSPPDDDSCRAAPGAPSRRPTPAAGSWAPSLGKRSSRRAACGGTSPCSQWTVPSASWGWGSGWRPPSCSRCRRRATRCAGPTVRLAPFRAAPTPAPHPILSRRQIVLEAELSNSAALRLYDKLGFVRDKRLPRYYMNGSDAFRLRHWPPPRAPAVPPPPEEGHGGGAPAAS